MKKFRKDIMFIVGILFAALFFWLFPPLFNRSAPAQVSVYQDGQQIGCYPLWEDNTLFISYGGDGSYNLLSIEKRRAFISDADCPDQLCVKQHGIERNGESIICLPHKLVVQIESGKERELDAVTY